VRTANFCEMFYPTFQLFFSYSKNPKSHVANSGVARIYQLGEGVGGGCWAIFAIFE